MLNNPGTKKYIVVGGKMWSRSDSDLHTISANRLCELYRVNPAECIMLNSEDSSYSFDMERLRQDHPTLPILRPRYDGNYELAGTTSE